MDYIREELLRQRRVLAALLAGGEDRRERTETGQGVDMIGEGTAPETEGGGVYVPWNGQGSTYSTAPEYEADALPWNTKRRRAAGTAAEAAGSAAQAAEDAAKEMRGGLWQYSAGAGTPQRYGRASPPRSAAGGGSAFGGGDVSEAETAVVWETAGFSAGGAPPEARELSRVFQRDARRYDGGFSLY